MLEIEEKPPDRYYYKCVKYSLNSQIKSPWVA